MPTLISIPTGYQGTSIIVVTPTVTLLFFHKKELNQAESSPYLKQTGIYIIYNQDQIYVGQSSNKDGLITRLRKHHQEKLWWEHTIVILPTQLMTKAHYDYQKIMDKMVCDLTEDERLVTFYDSEAKSFVTVPASNHPQSNLFKLTMQILSNNEGHEEVEEVQKPKGLKGLLHKFFNK